MKIPVSYCTNWNWEVLNQIVAHDICYKIVIVKLSNLLQMVNKSDFPCWNLTAYGNLSLKLAYMSFMERFTRLIKPQFF